MVEICTYIRLIRLFQLASSVPIVEALQIRERSVTCVKLEIARPNDGRSMPPLSIPIVCLLLNQTNVSNNARCITYKW